MSLVLYIIPRSLYLPLSPTNYRSKYSAPNLRSTQERKLVSFLIIVTLTATILRSQTRWYMLHKGLIAKRELCATQGMFPCMFRFSITFITAKGSAWQLNQQNLPVPASKVQ